MSALSLCLFGRLEVSDGHGADVVFQAKRVQELLCYLVMHRSKAHSRETLAGTLWAETSTVQSKKALRQCLWQLQSIVGQHAPQLALIKADNDWIALHEANDVWIDIAEFEQAYSQMLTCKERLLDDETAQLLREAVCLYRGDLLEGWYQDWCLFDRERLQNMFFAMLERLILHCEETAAYNDGIEYGQKVLRLDPAREQTHRRLMRLYYRTGDRIGALRQYERCERVLDEELGVTPSQKTVALRHLIQTDQLDTDQKTSTSYRVSLDLILSHLRRITESLALMQNQLQDEIHLLEGMHDRVP